MNLHISETFLFLWNHRIGFKNFYLFSISRLSIFIILNTSILHEHQNHVKGISRRIKFFTFFNNPLKTRKRGGGRGITRGRIRKGCLGWSSLPRDGARCLLFEEYGFYAWIRTEALFRRLPPPSVSTLSRLIQVERVALLQRRRLSTPENLHAQAQRSTSCLRTCRVFDGGGVLPPQNFLFRIYTRAGREGGRETPASFRARELSHLHNVRRDMYLKLSVAAKID